MNIASWFTSITHQVVSAFQPPAPAAPAAVEQTPTPAMARDALALSMGAGGQVVSNNGGSVISDKGAGLVDLPDGIVSTNGGNIVTPPDWRRIIGEA